MSYCCLCSGTIATYFCNVFFYVVFFFKQKTAYEVRISDWSSDVCSSDLSSAATRIGTRSPTVGVFLPPPLKIPQPASASSAIPTAGAFIHLIIALPCPGSGRLHLPLECPTSVPNVAG